jgi:hypothetical protein
LRTFASGVGSPRADRNTCFITRCFLTSTIDTLPPISAVTKASAPSEEKAAARERGSAVLAYHVNLRGGVRLLRL